MTGKRGELLSFVYSEQLRDITLMMIQNSPGWNMVYNWSEFDNGIQVEPMFLPVYAETWDNIKPMRMARISMPEFWDRINTLTYHVLNSLCRKYNYDIEELEEEKNVRSGAPSRPNDICQLCRMRLYGEIYVLEYIYDQSTKNHACLCAMCFHLRVNKVLSGGSKEIFRHPNCPHELTDISLDRITVLRVLYPRSVTEIVNDLDMSYHTKSLLVELLTGVVTISEDNPNVIKTSNYTGYSNLCDILMKKETTNKRAFVCKILS